MEGKALVLFQMPVFVETMTLQRDLVAQNGQHIFQETEGR
jgi:hypothetical protein